MPPLALSAAASQTLLDNKIQKLIETANKGGTDWSTKTNQYLATSYLIIKFWLPRLLLNADIYPMHFGLEARVPFAHNDLLALASTIAPELAMKNQCEKYCLKQIASGKIPSAIINRIKSSLPKDQSVGALYQQEFKIIAANSLTEDLIGRYLNWPEINRIASKAPLLTEKERAILFKVIAFYYWFVQLS